MFEYHGWFSSTKEANVGEIEKKLRQLNFPYPASVTYVNGNMHISFSGNPNHKGDYIESITDCLLQLNLGLYGIIYTNDADSENYNRFNVIKVINDKKYMHEDKNFTIEETRLLFE